MEIKMRHNKNIAVTPTSFLLLAAITAASIMSCSGGDDATQTQNQTTPAVSESQSEMLDFSQMSLLEQLQYANAQVPDDLPERDLGGAVIKLCDITVPTEETGSVLNDAAYRQYLAVMERYNCTFETVPVNDNGWSDMLSKISTLLLSGEDFASILRIRNTAAATFASQNMLHDLSTFDVIDIEKPWYFKEQIDLYSYHDQRYIVSGYMSAPLGGIVVVLYNKTIGENYDVENLYDVVREDRWTFDYVHGLCRDLYHDLNGNGTSDEDDLYAFNYAAAASFLSLLAIHEEPFVKMNANGDPYHPVFENPERMQSLMDSMKELLLEPGSCSLSDWDIEVFQKGNALLAMQQISVVKKIADTQNSYGILPVWKFDEQQSTYNTALLPDTWSIPINSSDPEQSAILMTALAAEAYREVVPASYETYLKGQIAMDEDSVEMLDLILNNGIRGDGGLMYDESFLYLTMMYLKDSRGFTSYMDSIENQCRNALQSVVDAYNREG